MVAYGRKALSLISAKPEDEQQVDNADQEEPEVPASDLGLHSLIRTAAGLLPPDDIMLISGRGVAHRCFMHVAEILGQSSARKARTIMGMIDSRGLEGSPVQAWLQERLDADGRNAQVSLLAFASFVSELEDAVVRDVAYSLLLMAFGTKDIPLLCEAVPALAWVPQSLRSISVPSAKSAATRATQSLPNATNQTEGISSHAGAVSAKGDTNQLPAAAPRGHPPPWRRVGQASSTVTLFLTGIMDPKSFFKLGRDLGFYVDESNQNAKFNGPRDNPFGGSLKMPRGGGGFQFFVKDSKVIVQGHEDAVSHWVGVLTRAGAEHGPVRGLAGPSRPPPPSAFDA